jgi:hypothetical protein
MRPSRVAAVTAIVGGVVALAVWVLDRPAARPASPQSPSSAAAAAVTAAAQFLVGLDAQTLLAPEARREYVTRWAGGSAEAELQRIYDAEARRVAPLDGGYSRAALLGYRVENLGGRTARVAIWAVSMASVGELPAVVDWRTLVVDLVHEDHRWHVAHVGETPGPSPDAPPERLRAEARRFEEFGVAP